MSESVSILIWGLSLAGIIFLTFITRYWLRALLIRKPYTADSLIHLRFVREVRRRGWKRARREMRRDYPLGYHWILSFLPESWMLKWERFNGGLFDSLHMLLFVAVFAAFAPKGTPPVYIYFWAPLLLAISPGWMYAGMGPRAYHLTERVLAELLIGAAFSGLWLFTSTGNWAWFAAAAVIAGFAVTASKFSAQVLVGFCPIIGILQHSVPIFLFPLATFAVAMVQSSGDYWTLLKGQTEYSLWYAAAIKRKEMMVWTRNSLEGAMKRYREFGAKGVLKWLVEECSFFSTPLHHVPFLIAVLAAWKGLGHLPTDTFPRDWLIAGFAIWFLTSLKWFLVLGEAERYPFHAAIAEYFFIGFWLASGVPPIWKWVFLGYSVVWYAAQQGIILIRLRHNKGESLVQEREQLMEFLNTLPKQRYMAFSKSHALTGEVMFFTDHLHPEIEIYDGKQLTYEDIFSVFPYPKWSMIDELGIGILVVNQPEMKAALKLGIGNDYDFGSMERLFVTETYAVYSVPNGKAEETALRTAAS